MVTLEHLKVYEAFGGDIDGWARTGGTPGMSDREWALIDELRQGLHLVASGLASKTFTARLEQKLVQATANESVRDRLRAWTGLRSNVTP